MILYHFAKKVVKTPHFKQMTGYFGEHERRQKEMITYKELIEAAEELRRTAGSLIEAANQLEETAANLPLVRDPDDDK